MLHHPPYRLGIEASEDILELAQCGALRQLGAGTAAATCTAGSARAGTQNPGIRSSLLLPGQRIESLVSLAVADETGELESSAADERVVLPLFEAKQLRARVRRWSCC
jgi:hypothetical protein